MKNVSLKFLKALGKGAKLYQEASIVFADGTELELARECFYISGNSYADAAGSNSFPLGSAFSKTISISLVNDKDQYSDYDFLLAEITVYCCMDFEDGTKERILFGTFTVIEPEAYGSIIEVTACDAMYRGDIEYTSDLPFPATARQVLQDSASACGVYLLTTTFANDDYIIQEKPEGVTHRDVWAACAMLAGGNARADEYNRLCVVGYDFLVLDQNGADGGYFDDSTPYASGDDVYGGVFDPWDEGDDIDGGTIDEMSKYQILYKAKNLTVSTDDVVITGIKTTEDDTEYMYGMEGYMLSVENPLISGSPQDAVDRIGSLLVGVRFRPFEMDHIAYPIAEFGDVCYLLDRNRNRYQSIITDVNFTFYGYTTIKCTADDPIRNSSEYHSNTTKVVRAARKDTKKQIREYDKAVQMLTNLMSQSFGVFKSEEVLEDGSVIYYMHNKPTLKESQTIWKMTADAFAVSTDGGLTWNIGMDSEGNAVVNVLSAIGIQADWIKADDLQAIGATIGGWTINKTQIFKVIDLYDDMSSSGLSALADLDPVQYWIWMRSPRESTTPVFGIYYMRKSDYLNGVDRVYPFFSAKANGEVIANTLTSDNISITGGTIRLKGLARDVYPIELENSSGQVIRVGPNGLICADKNQGTYARVSDGSIETGYCSVNGDIFSFDEQSAIGHTGVIYSRYTYDNVTSSSPNVYINEGGTFKRSSSSSERYKDHITEDMPDNLDPSRLYKIPVKSFRYKDGYLSKGDRKEGKDIIGFIVEDFVGVYDDALQYDLDGRPEMWNSQILIPAMLKLIQDQNKRIEALEERLKGV